MLWPWSGEHIIGVSFWAEICEIVKIQNFHWLTATMVTSRVSDGISQNREYEKIAQTIYEAAPGPVFWKWVSKLSVVLVFNQQKTFLVQKYRWALLSQVSWCTSVMWPMHTVHMMRQLQSAGTFHHKVAVGLNRFLNGVLTNESWGRQAADQSLVSMSENSPLVQP